MKLVEWQDGITIIEVNILFLLLCQRPTSTARAGIQLSSPGNHPKFSC